MRNRPISLRCLCMALLILLVLAGCTIPTGQSSPVSAAPVLDRYEYKQREKVCFFPSFTNENEQTEILSVSTEDGSFVCMTTDETRADAFLNAQRTLLHFLQANGMDVRPLNYVALNFDDNFSESGKNTAYIALSSTESWQQVLVTLQALWGDFADYGYVYAMANAIASHLGWETEPLEPAKRTAMNTFFRKNPQALHLLYPTFTARYASEETVRYSKSLSLSLFENIDWCGALKKPIETQLDEFTELLHRYSKKIGTAFSRQAFGYAYRGPYLPLCIRTTYATHLVDHGYRDYHSGIFDDYFGDYVTIYQTAELIDGEIVAAVARFGLEDRAGNLNINWISEESAMTKFAKRHVNTCHIFMQEAYVTTISLYLNLYYQHIEHLINPDGTISWQSMAFSEIGRSHSLPAQYATAETFIQDPEWSELFQLLTGHTYLADTESYFEVFDVLSYALNDFSLDLDYQRSTETIASFTYYLIRNYGEPAIIDLMLSPDTVTDITGKTWETLELEWKQSIMDRYADKELPDWLSRYQ